jgi:hypothetical protein
MASLFTKDTLPTSSEEAIRKFDERYNAIIAAAEVSSWAERFVADVDSPRITYPLSSFTSGFRETKEESGRYRGMSGKTFDVNVAEFDDGYEAKLADLLTNVFEWQRWGEVPGEFIKAEARHHARQLVTHLEAGTSTVCKYDGVNFFSTTHLANPFGEAVAANQWSNYQAGPLAPTLVNIAAEMTSMRLVKDVNGNKLGVEPDEIWLPTQKFQGTSDLLNQAFLTGGESNYMAGKLKPVHVPEFTDADDWMLVDSKLLTKYTPMLAARWTQLEAQLGLRWLNESSDHFVKTGKIAVSKHIWAGYALLFPHAIRLIKGA